MPKPLKKRYVFTAQEIARQNAALFEFLADDEKLIDVFKQVGLPSLAALYLDCLNGQIEKNKQRHIEALGRDIYRLDGINPDKYVIDTKLILEYLSYHGSKALHSELAALLKCLIGQNPKMVPDYNSALKKLFITCMIMQGNSLFLSFLLSDTRIVNLPVLVDIVYVLQIGQDKKLEQNCLHYANELIKAIYQQYVAGELVKPQNKEILAQLSSLVKAGDYTGALNKLKALKSMPVLSQLACFLLEAYINQNFQDISLDIVNTLKAFQTHLFEAFVRDVHRLGGITFYHPEYPKGRSLSINVHQREIVETDVATKNEIHRLVYAEDQDLRAIIIQYLRERFHLSNQDIAYMLLNMSQNDCCSQCEIAGNITYNFKKDNMLVFPAIPPNNLYFSLILDKHHQLRYLIGQSEMVGRQEGADRLQGFRFGTASLVHAIPSDKKQKVESVESYLPSSFPTVNVGVVYEPSCPQGEIHYLNEQRLSKRIVNFLLRPITYLKAHPFKSLLWFGIGASVTTALLLAWPFIAGLLMGTGLAGIAAAITSFVSSLTLIYLITAPLLIGLGVWGLIAMFKGGENHSSVIQMVASDSNFVSDKIAEMIAESKKEVAQAQKVQRSAGSTPQMLSRLNITDKPAAKSEVSELSVLSPVGSSNSVLSNGSQDSGELHSAAGDKVAPAKRSFCCLM